MPDFKSRFDGKFLTDTAWNYAAFAVMALTGVILNFFIAARLGIEVLGVFNQIYAVYVITAQFAVFGVHDSAQKHNAEFLDNIEQRDAVSAGAIWISAVFGSVTALGVFLLSGPIGQLAESPAVGQGVALAAPGLLFFAVNKVLMGILNGRRRMKEFAIAQSFRVIVILVSCLAVAALGFPGYVLGVSFTIAEVLLFPGLLVTLRPPVTGFTGTRPVLHWIEKHIRFGAKALTNGFLAESYIRVDIIMLGIFVSDHAVGIYSFAALFIEGLYQIPVVVRTIANPVLVRLLIADDKFEVSRFSRKVALLSLAVFAAAAGLVLVFFPALGPFFPNQLVPQSYPLLMILSAGLVVYSVIIPLDHILLQAGQPGRQSILTTFNVFANAALNLALIPTFGIFGAAVATAISFCLSSLTVNAAAWRWLGFRGGIVFSGTRFEPQGR
ncbi:MAG: hypothetical protein CMM60_05060 [Rhodospirillaceae bacterium]|jgi:O-antigen/teichoic acid export membrane protein|nr:hypothetical protein [Rhodospirillaceae bacterium]|tara:strand:- start:545 stop:1864 length:1320 start_codon:yes stop_codon:yes gene_type:complete